MVDYILKIDIDESDLIRKLKSALKKADMFTGGGAGSGFGAQMGGSAASAGSAKSALTEPAMKRIAEYAEKQRSFREGQANTLLLDNELKMGRKADAHGKTMERIGAVQNNWTKKMFNIGTVVKLAGLATGVAGLLQMRKMVIDSSPMLQAMLKLLNVGIMFILRPIGDFFGFVLRPLLVPFILMASKFYASRLGIISETGTDVGEALIDGDILTALDRFLMLGPILFDTENAIKDLEKRKLAEEEGSTFWDDLLNIFTSVSPSFNIFLAQMKGLKLLWDQTTIPEGIKAVADADADCPYAYPGGPPGPGADTTGIQPDMRGGDTDTETTGGTHHKLKLFENIGLSDSGVNTSVEQANDPYANKAEQENWMAIERELEELNQASLKREFDRLIPLEHVGITLTQEIIDLLRSNESKELFKSGGFAGDQNVADQLQIQIEEAEAIINSTESTVDEVEKAKNEIGKLRDDLDRHLDALFAIKNGFACNTARIEHAIETAALTTASYTGSQGTSTGKIGGSQVGACGQTFQVSPYTGMTAIDAGNAEAMAGGGVINEEIFGIGKCSGKKYRFGEKGDEAIIPMNCFNSLVGGMGRIGVGSMIGNKQTSGSVGQFQGISASRYSRFTGDVFNAANQQADAQSAVDAQGKFHGCKSMKTGYTVGPSSLGGYRDMTRTAKYGPTPEYTKYLKELNPLKADLAAATSMLESANAKLDPYAGAYSDKQTISALGGQREFEGGGANTTNLGGIVINVNGAQNPDVIVEQIGPKLLKYLQDNDSRVGIR